VKLQDFPAETKSVQLHKPRLGAILVTPDNRVWRSENGRVVELVDAPDEPETTSD
jgi:hypothetical protein